MNQKYSLLNINNFFIKFQTTSNWLYHLKSIESTKLLKKTGLLLLQ